MKTPEEIRALSDDELLRRLSDLLSRSRGIESELVVEIAPKPDVPPVMRKLPARSTNLAPSSAA
jgi:hypothetical protein